MGDSVQKCQNKIIANKKACTITLIFRNCLVILMKTQKQNTTL